MKKQKVAQFPLENGGYVLMEIDAPVSDRISRADEVAQKVQKTFEDALESIKPSANAIIKKLRTLNEPADEVEVKFGVKMNAGLDFVVAAGNAEANYEITLKWKQENNNGQTS
ncbi:MAG: CU044_2847 family protein [Cyanobacteriota bacterium]|nr:CU044_2847 family protein [Cyanobacteriota bacterium]